MTGLDGWGTAGTDMTYDGPNVLVYRAPYRGPDTYHWKEDASCVGVDTDLFELGDSDEMDQDDQQELIAWGLKICAGCPVKAQCLSESTELDRYWTVRGGQPPEGLFPDSQVPGIKLANNGRHGFKPGHGYKRKLKTKCHRGHEAWRFDKSGKRFCGECKKIHNQKRGTTSLVD